MSIFGENVLDISAVDENELKMKNLVKKGIMECDLAIIGVPFDGATFGRQGAKYAPKQIREFLYSFNTYSYNEDFSLKEISIADFGDVLVSNSDLNFTYDNIRKASMEAFRKSKLACFIGGDHSIAYSTLSSLSKLGSVSLIVLDAHHDLRRLKERFSSSGTYLRDLIEEKILNKVIQLGMRDFYNSEPYIEFARTNGIIFYTIGEIRNKGIKNVCEEVSKIAEESDTVYLSIDMDVLDASIARGVNSLCINGLYPHELIELVRGIARIKKLKGMDLVEIAPLYESDRITCMLAAYLILVAASSFFSNAKKSNIHS